MSSSAAAPAASGGASSSAAPRAAVPTPTWVPIVKTTLSSWRAGPTETAAATPSDAKPRDLYVVRCAGVAKSLLEKVLDVNGVTGAESKVVEMAAPRALAKGGTTPGAGPADPGAAGVSPPNGMSPGMNGTQDPAAPPPLESGGGGGVPAMSLGPALEEQLLKSSALTCAVLRDRRAAEDVQRKVTASGGDSVIVDIAERPCPATCTVVLKGVPLTIKHERLWQELTSLLSATPAYLRFHRNDRGLFKNVVYVRFASPVDAELGRMELERFSVGGRPLKVEFKKPKATTVEDSQRAEAARREDLRIATQAALESYVEQLAKSTENEAFTIPKAALNKDETRYLRGVAQAQEFTIDIGSVNITVKKRVTKAGVSPGMGPARTPPFHPATPSTHAADPDAAAGMQFRGIRHWRDQRSAVVGGHSQLGHMHTVGPADGTPAWSAGRGRPSKC